MVKTLKVTAEEIRGALAKQVLLSAIVGLMVVTAIGFCAWQVGPPCLGDAKPLLGSLYEVEPKNAELLYEAGDCALFAGETEADDVFNAAARKADLECPEIRNSLFFRQQTKDGTNVWRLVMTSGGGWKDAVGVSEWCKDRASGVRSCFFVVKARMSADGRGIWLVCDPHTSTYFLVCRYNFDDNSFRVLCDGDTADEQADGTILIKNKKTYLYDEKGVSLGAAWYDEWIDPDGKVVRKTKPSRRMLEE